MTMDLFMGLDVILAILLLINAVFGSGGAIKRIVFGCTSILLFAIAGICFAGYFFWGLVAN